MGGVNYFRNLFLALRSLPRRRVASVIVAGPSANREILAELGADQVLVHQHADSCGWRWKLRRALALGIGRDPILEGVLNDEGIALLSHMGYLGRRSPIPSLPWIPDFQERYLPGFFSPVELAARDRENRRMVRHATAILLSSEHAREGLAEISQTAASAARVLPFVAPVPHRHERASATELEAKFGVPDRYFLLPNQFWAHKNHEVVIRALGLLKRRGKLVTVIATGNLYDHRQPAHGQRLEDMIAGHDLSDRLRVLGPVSYGDLMGLMSDAVAVLNPSLFEGWSTTVEEAKSLGKLAIVSDIAVHREQAPERAVFFDPHDPDELAEILLHANDNLGSEYESLCMERAAAMLPSRIADFARRYEDIVCDVLAA